MVVHGVAKMMKSMGQCQLSARFPIQCDQSVLSDVLVRVEGGQSMQTGPVSLCVTFTTSTAVGVLVMWLFGTRCVCFGGHV